MKNIDKSNWMDIHNHMVTTLEQKIGILLTTEDAHTLTDGPTIFISEDVTKIGKFYIQQTKIPSKILDGITDDIGTNSHIQKRMNFLMKSLDDTVGKEAEKKEKKESFDPEAKKIMQTIKILRADIKMITMEPIYVPNTTQHEQIWIDNKVMMK